MSPVINEALVAKETEATRAWRRWASARSRRHFVRILSVDVQIGFCAGCGATEGGSYMGKSVLAELPLAASYMGTFVASPKRPLRKSRRNTGAMASSQSCGLSEAHPWLMLL
jgi:hypothetical protein